MKIAAPERLEALRDELLDEITREDRQLATPPEERGEDITPSQHPADVASDLFARESLLTTEQHLRHDLADVDEALRRFREGRYGICEDCGLPIPKERLEVRPQAARCVNCQRREEHRHAGS